MVKALHLTRYLVIHTHTHTRTHTHTLTTFSCGKPQSQCAARHPEFDTQLFGANAYVGGAGGHDAAANEDAIRISKDEAKREYNILNFAFAAGSGVHAVLSEDLLFYPALLTSGASVHEYSHPGVEPAY